MHQNTMISIIDDDESVRAATASLVRSLGFETSTFDSAEAFLQSPQSADSSCVISDVQMPGMTGIELQAELEAAGNRVPIIFITAFPEERIRRRAMAAGAICFLSKPFEGSEMIECINRALRKDG